MSVITTGLSMRGYESGLTTQAEKTQHRRHISVQAGCAIGMLGHAIEYMTDEYIHEAKHLAAHDSQLQAIQILMALNREIYYACPVQPTFTERLRAFLRIASR